MTEAGRSDSNVEGVSPKLRKVSHMICMGALIASEAEPLSAMRHRMCQADRVMRMDMAFYQNEGMSERRKQTRHAEVVQSCLLHSSESWSWTEELVDAVHG